MGVRDPLVVFIDIQTTGGGSFTINPAHILGVNRAAYPTSVTILVDNGNGQTQFIISGAHWDLLHNTNPFIQFVQAF